MDASAPLNVYWTNIPFGGFRNGRRNRGCLRCCRHTTIAWRTARSFSSYRRVSGKPAVHSQTSGTSTFSFKKVNTPVHDTVAFPTLQALQQTYQSIRRSRGDGVRTTCHLSHARPYQILLRSRPEICLCSSINMIVVCHQNCFYRSFIVALLQGFVDGGVMLPTGSPPANPLQAKYEEVLAYVLAIGCVSPRS